MYLQYKKNQLYVKYGLSCVDGDDVGDDNDDDDDDDVFL